MSDQLIPPDVIERQVEVITALQGLVIREANARGTGNDTEDEERAFYSLDALSQAITGLSVLLRGEEFAESFLEEEDETVDEGAGI